MYHKKGNAKSTVDFGAMEQNPKSICYFLSYSLITFKSNGKSRSVWYRQMQNFKLYQKIQKYEAKTADNFQKETQKN